MKITIEVTDLQDDKDLPSFFNQAMTEGIEIDITIGDRKIAMRPTHLRTERIDIPGPARFTTTIQLTDR